MELNFNLAGAKKYTSKSQIAKVLTEDWMLNNCYCPNCGENRLINYAANKPVADFFCENCNEDFELKSKSGVLGNKIVDGAYQTMIKRISSDTNPNFFFLNYKGDCASVRNLLIIPKYFFVPEVIEKRNPLKSTARRAGWIGCNINLTSIPTYGRIYIIKESVTIKKENVLSNWEKTLFIKKSSDESKGWLLDILVC